MKGSIENAEITRSRIRALIASEYESDAAFEREMDLPAKTVNNWRRGRSSSYMRLLPILAERFGVSVGMLLDAPIHSGAELSDDELRLLTSYRKAGALSPARRAALAESLERIIELYVSADVPASRSPRKRKDTKNENI